MTIELIMTVAAAAIVFILIVTAITVLYILVSDHVLASDWARRRRASKPINIDEAFRRPPSRDLVFFHAYWHELEREAWLSRDRERMTWDVAVDYEVNTLLVNAGSSIEGEDE
jgi:hypothetical protein